MNLPELVDVVGTVVILPVVLVILHHVREIRSELTKHEERISNVERRIAAKANR